VKNKLKITNVSVKNAKQISDLKNTFIAADGIEYAFENKIPLWLFGFLY
jgi:hypothetical protein